MLSINKKTLEDKMNTFLDVLNINGVVNIEWIKTQKAKFDLKYNETVELLDRYRRNKGKLLKLIDKNKILTPQYIEEYDIEDIKDIIKDNSVTNEIDINQLNREINRLSEMENRIKSNIDVLDEVLLNVSNKKGIGNVDKLEADTFNEHYYDMDRIREERGIILDDDFDKIISSETLFMEDDREEVEGDYFNYKFNGYISLKDLAKEVYGSSSYWTHIFNYEKNFDIITKILGTKDLDYDIVSSDPKYLKGVTLKVPSEIVSYTDEFNTKVLKQIKL
ncbi:MAG: hypothetical protein IKP76_00615 [Bacilli bacterium]|nr:hypothetical protein [Bacilli bacterium]